ncbi:MAG: class I SAM-dependent methyltransferase [Acidobacteriota bacterium]
MSITSIRLRLRHIAVLTPVCALLLLATLAVAGCAAGEGGDEAATASAENAAASSAASGESIVSYDPSILDDPARSEDDHYRDEGFKPLEVYGFFGVEPGMVAGDLLTSGLYNAHILSHIVGDEGRVLAIISMDQPSERSLKRSQDAFAKRNANDALANVEIVDSLSQVEDNSLDMLITVRNYHDLGDKEDRVAVLPRFLRVLKPGGIFGVVDAYSNKTDERDQEHHRINEQLVIDELTSAGFELVGTSDVLNNPDDTYDFDGREKDAPIHRYFIHRLVDKFRKPAS